MEAALAGGDLPEPVRAAWDARSAAIRPLAEQARARVTAGESTVGFDAFVTSLLDASARRVLRTRVREHALALSAFLAKHYESVEARQRVKKSA